MSLPPYDRVAAGSGNVDTRSEGRIDLRRVPNGPGDSGRRWPSFAISDGTHGGNPHFFFLPSLVPDPAPTGTFDPAVAPTVVICALSASTCGSTIATYTTTTGPGGEVVVDGRRITIPSGGGSPRLYTA